MQEPDMDKEWLLGFLQVWQRPLPPVAQLHCAPACVWLHAWILSAGALWGLKSLNPGRMAHPSPRCWYLRCHPCGSLLLHCTMPGMPLPALALRLKVAKVEQTAFHAGPWLPNSGRSVCLCQTPWSKLAACSEVRRALFGKVARQCSWPAALGCMKPIFRVLRSRPCCRCFQLHCLKSAKKPPAMRSIAAARHSTVAVPHRQRNLPVTSLQPHRFTDDSLQQGAL